MKKQNANQKVYERASEALKRLLKTKPYNSVTMTVIAQECGFSRQYLYRFYPDKQALLTDLFLHDLQRGIGTIFSAKTSAIGMLNALSAHSTLYHKVLLSDAEHELFSLFCRTAKSFLIALVESSSLRKLDPVREACADTYLQGVVITLLKQLHSPTFSTEQLAQVLIDSVPPPLAFLLNEQTTGELLLYKMKKRENLRL